MRMEAVSSISAMKVDTPFSWQGSRKAVSGRDKSQVKMAWRTPITVGLPRNRLARFFQVEIQ